MLNYQPIIQNLPVEHNCQVDVLRLDLIDPEVSGNKWFKLKYNLKKAVEQQQTTIITFGGAYSNHIAATAAMAKKMGFSSVGIIRGEDDVNNPTLKKARENGMILDFVSREVYKHKTEPDFARYLEEKFGHHYLIPEGGNNVEGALGCVEILKPEFNYDYILCACGTGTTFAGLVTACKPHSVVVGINVLRGVNQMPEEVATLLAHDNFNQRIKVMGNKELNRTEITNHCITNSYSFNGYAGYNPELINFKSSFEKKYNLLLDYVYTNKLFYATFDLLRQNKFKANSKLLVIHSGGLQGNEGFEKRYHLSPTL